MELELYPPFRACRFCISFQGGSVFGDFDVDPDGRVFAVRVSFDGYGCCDAPEIGRMSMDASTALLAQVSEGSLDATAADRLRTYFRQNRDVLWSDALEEHGLV